MRNITIICIVAVCFAGAASAQQSRYSSGWSNPDAKAATVRGPANAEVRKLTDEFKVLIDDAERARAADPRFLRDLRRLTRRYAWPWRRLIVRDDFSDGEWNNNPPWSLWGKGLRVTSWEGLTMRVADWRSRQRSQDRDLGITGSLLESVFEGLARQDGDRRRPARQAARVAGIKTVVTVPNAFAIRVTFSSTTRGGGRLEIGVTQGKRNAGYRLAYNAGARPSFELIRVGRRGIVVIDAVEGPIRLEDGKKHVVQLTRNRRGRMTVSLDGKELLRVRDSSFRSAFDGFLMINKGGEYTIRSVAVYGAG